MGRGRQLPVLRLTEIVMRAAEGGSVAAIAGEVGICPAMVRKWWHRFDAAGSMACSNEPRPGQPRKRSDAEIEQVIVRTLESKPPAAAHWSTRTMARATGLNQTAISRIWRAFSLAPHRSETFKLSKDPLFIDKVRDIVAL